MIAQQNLIDAIRTKILNTIGSEVGDRVYNNRGFQDSELPMCIFDVVGDVPDKWFGTDSLNADLQVVIFGWAKEGGNRIRTISDKLYLSLHKKPLDIVGYDYSFVDGGERGIFENTDDIMSIRTDFNIVASEDANIS